MPVRKRLRPAEGSCWEADSQGIFLCAWSRGRLQQEKSFSSPSLRHDSCWSAAVWPQLRGGVPSAAPEGAGATPRSLCLPLATEHTRLQTFAHTAGWRCSTYTSLSALIAAHKSVRTPVLMLVRTPTSRCAGGERAGDQLHVPAAQGDSSVWLPAYQDK